MRHFSRAVYANGRWTTGSVGAGHSTCHTIHVEGVLIDGTSDLEQHKLMLAQTVVMVRRAEVAESSCE